MSTKVYKSFEMAIEVKLILISKNELYRNN